MDDQPPDLCEGTYGGAKLCLRCVPLDIMVGFGDRNEGALFMRVFRTAVSVAGIALALGLAGPAATQPQNTFTLKLCNATGKDIIVALAHRISADPGETRFVVRGWASMKEGCADGDLPR